MIRQRLSKQALYFSLLLLLGCSKPIGRITPEPLVPLEDPTIEIIDNYKKIFTPPQYLDISLILTLSGKIGFNYGIGPSLFTVYSEKINVQSIYAKKEAIQFDAVIEKSCFRESAEIKTSREPNGPHWYRDEGLACRDMIRNIATREYYSEATIDDKNVFIQHNVDIIPLEMDTPFHVEPASVRELKDFHDTLGTVLSPGWVGSFYLDLDCKDLSKDRTVLFAIFELKDGTRLRTQNIDIGYEHCVSPAAPSPPPEIDSSAYPGYPDSDKSYLSN